MAPAIQEKLVELRVPIAFAAAFAAAAFALVWKGPSFSDVVAYFWPLLLSTGCFLAAVAVVMRTSPPAPVEESTGEDLIDYIAGRAPDAEATDGEEEEEEGDGKSH